MDESNDSALVTRSGAMVTSSSGWSVGGIEHSVLVRTAYALICTVGIVGNALVCIVLLRVQALRTKTNHLLVHLSVVDIMVCIMALPVNLFPTPPPMHGPFGDFLCRFYVSKYMQWVCMHASEGSLVLVNLERFVAIVYPLKYKSIFTSKKIAIMICIIWVEALSSLSYFFGVFSLMPKTGCTYHGWPTFEVQVFMGVYPYLMHYVGPLVFMFAAQWKMISSLKKQVAKITQQHTDAVAARRKLWQVQASQELQRTLLFVVITYAICWGPNQTMFFCFMLGVKVDFTHPYYHIGVIMGVMNSCLNPFIYTVRNKPFRNALKKVAFCKIGRVTPVVPAEPSTKSLARLPPSS